MNRALFLDRDGVINVNHGYCNRVDQFHLTDGISRVAGQYARAGYLLIVVTNQAGIAHGHLTHADLEAIHRHMAELFSLLGHPLRGIYYCPDTEGPNRKPEPGMLLQAQRDFDIDMAASVIIGDQITDIEAGRRAGVGCCILIPPDRLDAVPVPT